MGNLIENYGNETNMIQSNPGVVIGISKPTETGIVSTVRNNIAYKIEIILKHLLLLIINC